LTAFNQRRLGWFDRFNISDLSPRQSCTSTPRSSNVGGHGRTAQLYLTGNGDGARITMMHQWLVKLEDITLGKELYARLGSGDIKHRSCLTTRNILSKAMLFWQFKLKRSTAFTSLQSVLLEMLHSTKFYPAPNWVVSSNGTGMNKRRAVSAWKATVCPTEVDAYDVENIFFSSNSSKFRYFNANQDDDDDDMQAGSRPFPKTNATPDFMPFM
jgi:hypothetical protein